MSIVYSSSYAHHLLTMIEAHKLPKRRGRIARSCDACYLRKIKCDAATPKCDWCSHHDLDCTFTRLSRLPDAAAAKGSICTFDGTPFFSKWGRDWVYHCTGEIFHPEYLQPAEPAAQLPSTTTGFDLPLPDWTFLYEKIQQYQASQLGLLFLVIDRSCLCAQGLAGDFYTVDQLLSAAVRYACYLKGHVSPCAVWENPSDADRHTRTLFWIVYVYDKGLSMGPTSTPTFYLAFLQSRVQRELYSPQALQKSEADLIRTIRDLDRELDEWEQPLQSTNQPSAHSGGGYSQQYIDMRLSVFQLQYYHCTVMIHQASSCCVSWVQNQKARGPGSSLAVAVTASRSLLQQFVGSCLALGPANLLFSISYFVQAIIVLFCNILSNPLDESSQGDLQLSGPSHLFWNSSR
ncbi:uncharacterized protein BDW70DRAFT_159975 [Aspergillus foveolatus]|uniref:uncharacterized protein n=1 Tax=Aspergillus foveolatus TaxID=210207 RepID=UPI003CCE37A8